MSQRKKAPKTATLVYPITPRRKLSAKQSARRDALSEESARRFSELGQALRTAERLAEELTEKPHRRGCCCRVCVCGPQFEREVETVGRVCGLLGETLRSW